MPSSIVKMLETIANCPLVSMTTRHRAVALLGRNPIGSIFAAGIWS